MLETYNCTVYVANFRSGRHLFRGKPQTHGRRGETNLEVILIKLEGEGKLSMNLVDDVEEEEKDGSEARRRRRRSLAAAMSEPMTKRQPLFLH